MSKLLKTNIEEHLREHAEFIYMYAYEKKQ